jgi:hypothetical protein
VTDEEIETLIGKIKSDSVIRKNSKEQDINIDDLMAEIDNDFAEIDDILKDVMTEK